MGKSNILFQRPDHGTNPTDNSDIVLIKLKFLVVCVMEDIIVEDKEKTLLTDICYENQIDKQEELVVRAIQNLQQSSTRFIHTTKWAEKNSLLLFHCYVRKYTLIEFLSI